MIRDGDWMCSSCQHQNFRWRDSCQRCGCLKFGGGIVPQVLPGDWYCNNCVAHNYASRTNCYQCGASKDFYSGYGGSSSVGSSGDNVTDGSGLPGWRSGDWLCTRVGCNTHNYASRMECFKCRTPRDFSG